MKNKIIISVISAIAILLFLFVAYKLTNTKTTVDYPEVNKISSLDHLKWATDSAKIKNILVEYSDFQCPACKLFHDTIRSEIENKNAPNSELTKKITFVYRDFPLDQHQNAKVAAYAAEAAGKQNKFFEFGDILFDKQNEWGESNDSQKYFDEYAKSLALNLDQFHKDMNSNEVKNKVDTDVLSGEKASLNATPTFYFNGKKLENINSFADFLQPLIDGVKNN